MVLTPFYVKGTYKNPLNKVGGKYFLNAMGKRICSQELLLV